MNSRRQSSVGHAVAIAALAFWIGNAEVAHAVSCGEGLLEAAETCEACPADCRPAVCKPSKEQRRVVIDLVTPGNLEVNAAHVRLAYRSDRVTLGAQGDGAEVKKRVSSPQKLLALYTNNLGYAVGLVAVRGQRFDDGELAEITF